jgi:predicted permease
VLAGRIAPSPVKYSDAARLTALYDEVLERAKALPGVRVAALTSVMPFGGDSDVSFEIEGRPPASRSDLKPVAWYRLVSAGYFQALGLQAVHGRLLADTEAAPVLVVNETLARRYWPAENALGKRIRTNADAPWFTVVGVVADMRSRGPTRPAQVEMFIPYRFAPERPAWILLRTVGADRPAGTPQDRAAASTRGDSLAPTLAGALRRTISEIDPELPVSNVQALEARVAEQVAPERFLATLTTAFGLLALFIGACGIYGVMAYLVSTRTLELGVRTALGAAPRDLFALVMGHGLRTTAVGIACGLAGAVIGGRWVRSLLFETRPTDVTALVLAVAVLGAAAVAACYVPARRAMRVEPLHALRQE